MATAPKAVPKVVPVDDAAGAAAPASKSKKKLFLIVAILVLLLAGGGAAAWLFMGNDGGHEAEGPAPAKTKAKSKSKAKPGAPPVYMALEPFTVNLQRENGDQFLQVGITVQVGNQEEVESMKVYMPLLRSRLLMLLSSKKASEIETAEGKKKLQEEITKQLQQPFAPQGEPQEVSGVFFTSFVIQ
jgi:flagellar FliL protein